MAGLIARTDAKSGVWKAPARWPVRALRPQHPDRCRSGGGPAATADRHRAAPTGRVCVDQADAAGRCV